MSRRRWALGGRLDRYVAGNYVAALLVAAGVLVGLYLIVNLAANVDDWLEPDGEHTPGQQLLRVGGYCLLRAPFLFLSLAPFVTLIAGLFTMARLRKSGEMVAALSIGISARRLMAPIFFVAGLMAVGCFLGREQAVARLGFHSDTLGIELDRHQPSVRLERLRLKDRQGEMIRLDAYVPGPDPSGDGARFEGLDAVRLTGERWIHYGAARGTYRGVSGFGYWELEGGWREDVGSDQRTRTELEALSGGLEFHPYDVWIAWKGRSNPMDLSYAQATLLSSRDPDNVQYRTLRQYLLTFPLANLVLLLCGLPFLMSYERGREGIGPVAGFLLCVFYFCADFVCLNLGMQGHISPLLAAWLPPTFFGSLGVVLFCGGRS